MDCCCFCLPAHSVPPDISPLPEIRSRPEQEKMLKRTPRSLSFRRTFRRTARKSLEIIEKRASYLSAGSGGGGDRLSTKPSSVAEALSWADPGQGFQNLLGSAYGRRLFGEFLRKEFSEENLMFWTACEAAKTMDDEMEFLQQVECIFEKFLTASSAHEVSLDSRVRDKVTQHRAAGPDRTMFEECQAKIYSLMHRDSYPRFLSSSLYKDTFRI